MNQQRKDQLNKKLGQIYEHGSGRTYGVIDTLLQVSMFGHIYFVHNIKDTIKNPPWEEDDTENKDYTLVELGLYQDGNACIETFSIPFSENALQQLAASIDMAYYRWMQKEPQITRKSDPFEYYRTLFDVTTTCTYDLSSREFDALSKEEQDNVISDTEWYAFLPQEVNGE